MTKDAALVEQPTNDFRQAVPSSADRAMLEYAAKLTQEPWNVKEADVIALHEAGFEMELTLKLEIGLRPQREDGSDGESPGSLELTDEDMRVLQAMKIKIEPED